MTVEQTEKLITRAIENNTLMLYDSDIVLDDEFFEDLRQELTGICQRDGLDSSVRKIIDRAVESVKARFITSPRHFEDQAAAQAAL